MASVKAENMEDVDNGDCKEMEADNEDILEDYDEQDAEIDPLLTLMPIVYTTKLDEMNTIKQNLRQFNPKEITKMLISESKPKLTPQHIKPPSNSENLKSYKQLSGVVQWLNLKAKMHVHSIYVRNLKLWNQCKPFSIILEDIKHTVLANNLSKESQPEPATTVSSHGVDEVQVKVEDTEETYSDNEINGVEIKEEVDIPWTEIRTVIRHVKTEVIDIDTCETTSSETLVNKIDNSQNKILRLPPAKNAKSIELQHNDDEIAAMTELSPVTTHRKDKEILYAEKTIKDTEKNESRKVSSSKKVKTIRRICANKPESTNEDDLPLLKLKRKTVASVARYSNSPTDDKNALILLVHKKKQAFMYRLNSNNLITDYFITRANNEYNLAAMCDPNDKRVVEHYCCWFKREEAITKLCARKSYSYQIQFFLRQPHSCAPGDCQCCCFTKESDASNINEISQERKRDVLNKSLAVADSWIRGLLARNKNVAVGLVGKALNYIPKAQVKHKVFAKESKKYLEFVILWMKYTGCHSHFNDVPELFEIGKNGDVVRSFIILDSEKCQHIRRTYQLMGMETLTTEFCCWYTRDKLITDLRASKISPTALKSVQISHVCAKYNCSCCCKPQMKPLKDVEVLPATVKHTTDYEKCARPLNIVFDIKLKTNFLVNKMTHYTNTKSSKIITITDTSTAVLSSCVENNDECNLSTIILNKFKSYSLGVNSDGKLEAVLEAPARNLSVAQLKVLSDKLAFSTNQIARLGISPEEFCERINSKSIKANDAIAPEDPHTNNSEIASPGIAPPRNMPPLSKVTKPSVLVTTTITNVSKATSNVLYASMTNLMEKKNKSYVDSFKSFFKNVCPTDFVVPKTNTCPPAVNKLSSKQPFALPIIAETFTLAKSSNEPDVNVGPLVTTQKPAFSRTEHINPVVPSVSSFSPVLASTASLKTYNTRLKSGISKRKVPLDCKAVENKKIRVKVPSELMAMDTEVAASTVTPTPVLSQTGPAPKWPAPIMLKREPISNIQTIVNTSQFPIQTNPNLHSGGYVSAVPASNVIVPTTYAATALNNVYQVDGSSAVTNTISTASTVTGTDLQSNPTNSGLRFLTLTPVTTNNSCATMEKSMLSKILRTPQVRPPNAASSSRVPQFVPIAAKPNVAALVRVNAPIPRNTYYNRKKKQKT